MCDTMDVFYDKSKPKKEEQSYGKLAVQQRMRLAMAFLHPLRPVVAESWLGYGKGNKSKAFGQALKALMQEAIGGHYPDQYVEAARVSISMGILPAVKVAKTELRDNALEVHFSSEQHPLANGTDEVVLVAYCPEAGIAARNTDAYLRTDGHIRVPLPSQLHTQPFHAYLFLQNVRKKQFSKSIYLGIIGK